MTTEQLQAELDRLDKGLLRRGQHTEGQEEFCALEFESQVRGRDWSDRPITLPDLRPINDAFTDDEARTRALLPVMAALWDWSTWSNARRQRWAECVALETVRQLIADLPWLSPEVAQQCRTAQTLGAAAWAAEAAAWATRAAAWAAWATEVAWAAEAAARATRAAARAATEAAWAAWATEVAWAAEAAAWATRAAARAAEANTVLERACQIWIAAVATSEAADA